MCIRDRFNPGNTDSSGLGMLSIGYTDKKLNISAGWHKVNINFIADVGFTPRLYNYDAQNDTVTRVGYNAYTTSLHYLCLLYTSDAADERSSVDLGGRRI